MSASPNVSEHEQPVTDLASVYRRYSSYVAAVGHRLLGRGEDVDDLVQDVFVEAVRGIDKLREPAAIKGWLVTVAVRQVQRKLRKRKLLRAIGWGSDEDYEQLADQQSSPEERLHVAKLYQHLDGLPTAERIAWILRHVEQYKLEELAPICECSLATVKRRIKRAETYIENKLKEDGGRHA